MSVSNRLTHRLKLCQSDWTLSKLLSFNCRPLRFKVFNLWSLNIFSDKTEPKETKKVAPKDEDDPFRWRNLSILMHFTFILIYLFILHFWWSTYCLSVTTSFHDLIFNLLWIIFMLLRNFQWWICNFKMWIVWRRNLINLHFMPNKFSVFYW